MLFDLEEASKISMVMSGVHISEMMAPYAPSPTYTVPFSVGVLPTIGLVLLKACTWFSKAVITLYLSKLGTQWNRADRYLDGSRSKASQTEQMGTWQLTNFILLRFCSNQLIMNFFWWASKVWRQPLSRPMKCTLAKVQLRMLLRCLRGGTLLTTCPSRLRSQCCGKYRKQAGPLLSTVMLTPGSSLRPTSWLPTTLTMGIRQPRVAVSWPYMPKKQSQVQAQAGMLSSQAMSPPIMKMSGLRVEAILVRLMAALVQPESPALIIRIGRELLSGRVRQIALVRQVPSQYTLVRYEVSGFSPVIKAECTFLAAFHSRPWYSQLTAVTLRNLSGSGASSYWQNTVTQPALG